MSALVDSPTSHTDPINAQILAVSEDRVQGFVRDPFGVIAEQSGVDVETVMTRIAAMLRAGTIRRVRQTLMATNLAEGALVAWQYPADANLDAAFDFMFQEDPFSGHVVIRSTDAATAGSNYRLWTTVKVPQGYSIEKHCAVLAKLTGAEHFRVMPAHRIFALGVGHVRRKGMAPGSKSDELAVVKDTAKATLSDLEWRVLTAVKRELTAEEVTRDLWARRAAEADVPLETFFEVAEGLNRRGVVGRFSTFLEHVKAVQGERVTRFNALFHWAVPPGRELEAGQQMGRFHILTHCYWREGGPEFRDVNIMAVAHGTEKETVLAHKRAMDEHLEAVGIPVSYTNVFWGGRSEIKPSEISPFAYLEWCESRGIAPESLRE
jgi:DNA-binding Lrp family transcriptional regulator